MNDLPGLLILVNGAGDAGIGAVGFGAMPALKSKGVRSLFLDNDKGRWWYFSLEGFYNVP